MERNGEKWREMKRNWIRGPWLDELQEPTSIPYDDRPRSNECHRPQKKKEEEEKERRRLMLRLRLRLRLDNSPGLPLLPPVSSAGCLQVWLRGSPWSCPLAPTALAAPKRPC